MILKYEAISNIKEMLNAKGLDYLLLDQVIRTNWHGDSTIGVDTEGKVIFDGAVKDFSETYPALPATVRYLNISSGTQYDVLNLKIR